MASGPKPRKTGTDRHSRITASRSPMMASTGTSLNRARGKTRTARILTAIGKRSGGPPRLRSISACSWSTTGGALYTCARRSSARNRALNVYSIYIYIYTVDVLLPRIGVGVRTQQTSTVTPAFPHPARRTFPQLRHRYALTHRYGWLSIDQLELSLFGEYMLICLSVCLTGRPNRPANQLARGISCVFCY